MFDLFISEECLFVLHSLKVFDVIVVVGEVSPLTHLETLNGEGVVDLFMDGRLVC